MPRRSWFTLIDSKNMRVTITLITTLVLMLGVMNSSTFAQTTPSRTTVWAGAYNEAQATQGQTVFAARCSRCHGGDLNGGAVGTSLIGDRFMQFWREDTVASLYIKIRDTMPRNSGGSLSEEEYVNVTAY